MLVNGPEAREIGRNERQFRSLLIPSFANPAGTVVEPSAIYRYFPRATLVDTSLTSRVERIVWAGIRFGAIVAAGAIARGGDAAALALWEPV